MVTCKLCLEERELKNSHIIPEFIYSSLYDEKHRFHEISVDENKKNKLPQKGVREYLLCGECEQLLSKNERYASLVLNGRFSLTVRKDGKLIHLGGIEYSKFKLFALSVLWRAGISSLDVFDQVKLGPHENVLRNMILNSEPGGEEVYPFLLSPILHENVIQEGLIVTPTWTRLGSHYAYRFVFGGITWVFVVSGHKAPNEIVNASISENGELTMIPWNLSDMKFITHVSKELARQGKL
jgi:hypothetical protein